MDVGTLVTIKNLPPKDDGTPVDYVHFALYPSESGARTQDMKSKVGEIGTVVMTRETSAGVQWCMVLMRTGTSGWLPSDEVETMI